MILPQAVVLAIPNLSGGGAERVMVNMARWWAERGTAVTLITFDAEPTAYAVHSAVQRLFLNALAVESPACIHLWPEESLNVARLRAALRETPEHAAVLSFLPRMNLRTLLAARGLGRRVLVSERAWPPLCPLGAQVEALRRKLYPEADCVVVQTQRCAKDWAANVVAPERVAVVPNALPRPSSQPETLQPKAVPRCFFLAVGRLEAQKNFCALIEAFALIACAHPHVELVILGEGPERSVLESRMAQHNLTGRVHLLGFVTDIAPYSRQALAHVLTSTFEGFPNVLLEAMAEGCPVVAFDCPTGPSEIVRHGVDGLLVPPGDIVALAAAMERLLCDSACRTALAQRALEVQQRFSEDAIMDLWNSAVRSERS